MKRLMLAPVLVVAALLAGCTTAGSVPARTTTVPTVDLARYAGTWYELGSVKQFFSVGLVNTTADYTVSADGRYVVVVNRGRYKDLGGIESSVVGSAFPVDPSNARLNVSFSGSNTINPPGNYWIVDLDPAYGWAIVSDPTGMSAFILSRTPTVAPGVYDSLVARAAARGVEVGNLTPTQQGWVG